MLDDRVSGGDGWGLGLVELFSPFCASLVLNDLYFKDREAEMEINAHNCSYWRAEATVRIKEQFRLM